MRNLPCNPTKKQRLIMEAVKDYFGEMNPEGKKSATKIALVLMRRRKRVVLTEEEKEIKGAIKKNLADRNPPSKIDCSEFCLSFCSAGKT